MENSIEMDDFVVSLVFGNTHKNTPNKRRQRPRGFQNLHKAVPQYVVVIFLHTELSRNQPKGPCQMMT